MPFTITRRYTFEAAHWLPGVPETHKCHRIHGHNYEIDVCVGGQVNNQTGFIIDFADLDLLVNPLIAMIDHRLLNDIEGLSNPTAEYIAAWFAVRLGEVEVKSVTCFETKNCWATVNV